MFGRDRSYRGASGLQIELDGDLVDAVHGPPGVRLLIEHSPRNASNAARIVETVWRGIGTTSDSTGPE